MAYDPNVPPSQREDMTPDELADAADDIIKRIDIEFANDNIRAVLIAFSDEVISILVNSPSREEAMRWLDDMRDNVLLRRKESN